MQDQLLDVAALAKRYGKSVSGIYHMNCYTPDKLPPSVRIGKSLRWRLEDVRAWEANQNGTAALAGEPEGKGGETA